VRQLENFIEGRWVAPRGAPQALVTNPATARPLASLPVSDADAVNAAAAAAERACALWRRVPAIERAQFLFRFRQLLEEHQLELARLVTDECGKTRAESMAELRRGLESVETACGAPAWLQGRNNEDIAAGIDEHLFRQPLGVVAAITPFNFPAMIPLWFLPFAIACGNCIIVKPSERVSITSVRLFELLAQTGLPAGVAQLVLGGRQTADLLIDHPVVQAVSFVGSTAAARDVYARAARAGKRAQCQGGAKNAVVILPDADLEGATAIVAESAFGCAGQRCLAASLAITVGGAADGFGGAIAKAAQQRAVGYGWHDGVQMGPLISRESQQRVTQLIGAGCQEGAQPRCDGRGRKVVDFEEGFFVYPTVLEGVSPVGLIAQTEIFGPVLGLIEARDLDEAIQMVNAGRYGNMACLFTSSGAAARRFRHEVTAGNVGINIGVAAPMAAYPFSGCKESFFGDLHAQGRHAFEFYTQTKVVVERWPR
jgi:malonate-semialdehyde dehydrogenase (acetylating)/methylmalonate-semialdehyde dehydrogenase